MSNTLHMMYTSVVLAIGAILSFWVCMELVNKSWNNIENGFKSDLYFWLALFPIWMGSILGAGAILFFVMAMFSLN